VDSNGQNRKQYIENPNYVRISAMDIHLNQIYYTNLTDSTMRRISQNLTSEILHTKVTQVTNMLIAHSLPDSLPLKFADKLKKCQLISNRRGCLCIQIESENFTCKCPDHEDIDAKSGRCVSPSKFVIMTSRDRFVRFKIDQDPKTFNSIYTKVIFYRVIKNKISI
jgi:hypothetical protein